MLLPIALSPVARKTPPFPGLEGPYKPNQELKKVELYACLTRVLNLLFKTVWGIFIPDLTMVISFIFDAQGKQQSILSNTGGRPLGMKFSPTGN